MRITKKQLKRIIKEEYHRILNEAASDHYNVNFTKEGVTVNKGTGGGADELFTVMKGQQPYYSQIVKAARGDAKGMQALKDQIEEKDGNSNIKDGDITFGNRPMAESVSRDQLRNIIRQEYRSIVRENRRRRRY